MPTTLLTFPLFPGLGRFGSGINRRVHRTLPTRFMRYARHSFHGAAKNERLGFAPLRFARNNPIQPEVPEASMRFDQYEPGAFYDEYFEPEGKPRSQTDPWSNLSKISRIPS